MYMTEERITVQDRVIMRYGITETTIEFPITDSQETFNKGKVTEVGIVLDDPVRFIFHHLKAADLMLFEIEWGNMLLISRYLLPWQKFPIDWVEIFKKTQVRTVPLSETVLTYKRYRRDDDR